MTAELRWNCPLAGDCRPVRASDPTADQKKIISALSHDCTHNKHFVALDDHVHHSSRHDIAIFIKTRRATKIYFDLGHIP